MEIWYVSKMMNAKVQTFVLKIFSSFSQLFGTAGEGAVTSVARLIAQVKE